MKNFIKLLFVVVVLSMAAESYAQTFGVKAGLNLSNMLEKDDDDTYSNDYKMLPGFHVGFTAEFPITEIFSFEPGLLLSTKGFKYEDSETYQGETIEYKYKVGLYYLDIPLNFKATHDLGGAKIYGVLGPYLGMGLSGKHKTEISGMGESETEEEDVKWGTDVEDDDLKRVDFGLNFGAGAEIKSFLFDVNYELGLANISPDNEGGYKFNNRVLSISVGYRFGGK